MLLQWEIWASYAAMHHGPPGRQSFLLIIFLLFVFLLSDATTQSIIIQSCELVNGNVRDLTTTLLGESRRLSRAHVHDHVQRIGIRSDGGGVFALQL